MFAVVCVGRLDAPLTAVVTGANRGLGLALADLLAARGTRVLLTCRTGGDECEQTAAVLSERGRDCVE
eukprot:448163-Prymnesium_polylepis.1